MPNRRFPPLLLALLGLGLVLLPFGLLRQHSYFIIHDSLNADFSLYHVLRRAHLLFDYRRSAVVPALMDGLPRNALRPGLSVVTLLFAVLPPWAAYITQQSLARLAGLLGMYALLQQPGLLPGRRRLAAVLALAWATLPAYTIYGASLLGQPALLLAFLALRRDAARWWPWALLVLYAAWSTFVLVGPFVLVALGVGVLWDWWHRARPSAALLAGMALLLAAYGVVEWPLFYSLLTRQFVPHRLEFDLARLAPVSFGGSVWASWQLLLRGQYHASSFLQLSAPLAVGLALAGAPAAGRVAVVRRYLPGLLGLAGLALLGGFYPLVLAWGKAHWAPAATFNFGRFYFLGPLLFFLVLALAVRELPRRWQAAVLGLQLLLGLAANTELTSNLRLLAGRRPPEPGYAAYVAPALFAQVRACIQQQSGLVPSQYRVACLGMAPAVAQLNDFYTLDSYQNYYPLAYKHRFRPLIAGELAKSEEIASYFDAWGSRCYLLSAELGRNFQVGAAQARTVQDFAFDAAAFRRLGGRYVLSAARLATPARSGLRLVQVFERPDAYWRVWLYEVAE